MARKLFRELNFNDSCRYILCRSYIIVTFFEKNVNNLVYNPNVIQVPKLSFLYLFIRKFIDLICSKKKISILLHYKTNGVKKLGRLYLA